MLKLDLEQLGHFDAGTSRAGDRHRGILVDLEDFFDPALGDLKSFRRSTISGNHHTLLILDRKHCGGMRNAHRAGTAHRLDRGLGLQESATAGRSQRGMVLGQKVEETRVVVVGEKWQFHSINREASLFIRP